MSKPLLFIKKGCPFCRAAMEYLDEQNFSYEKLDVRGDDAGMQRLKDVSGQTKTPTLVWNDQVLADFGVEQLQPFLAKQQ